MPMKAIKIDPVPEFVRPSFRTKHVCLTLDDWGRIGDDLVRQFPTVRFRRQITTAEWRAEAPPDIQIESSLRPILWSSRESYAFDAFFNPDFQLGLRRELYKPYEGDGFMVWRYNRTGVPRLDIKPAGRPHRGWNDKGPERLSRAKIDFAGEPGNKSHLMLAQQIFGIIRRQVKKAPLLRVDYPSYESRASVRDTRLEWITDDAMRWAREDPKRLLMPNMKADGTGWGYRPVD